MAVPKRRTSKRKKRARNTHKVAPKIVVQSCPKCGEMKRPRASASHVTSAAPVASRRCSLAPGTGCARHTSHTTPPIRRGPSGATTTLPSGASLSRGTR